VRTSAAARLRTPDRSVILHLDAGIVGLAPVRGIRDLRGVRLTDRASAVATWSYTLSNVP
jgi:hypothetical protein